MDVNLPIIIDNELDTTYNPSSIKKTPDGVAILESQLAAERINSTSTYKNIMNVKYTILKTYSDTLQLQTTAFPTINNGVYSQPSGLNSIVSNKDNSIIPLARSFFLNLAYSASDFGKGIYESLQFALTSEIIENIFESFTKEDGIKNVGYAIQKSAKIMAITLNTHYRQSIGNIKNKMLRDILENGGTNIGDYLTKRTIMQKQHETKLLQEGLLWFKKDSGIGSFDYFPTYDFNNFKEPKYSREYESHLKLTP
jgi:hypothetical protein